MRSFLWPVTSLSYSSRKEILFATEAEQQQKSINFAVESQGVDMQKKTTAATEFRKYLDKPITFEKLATVVGEILSQGEITSSSLTETTG